MKKKEDKATQETTKALWVIHNVLTGGVFQTGIKKRKVKDEIKYVGIMRKLTFRGRVLQDSEMEIFRLQELSGSESIAHTKAFYILGVIQNTDPQKISELIDWLRERIVL